MRYLATVYLVALSVFSVSAQTRSVTNADLEKYRLERERAESEYRNIFAKRGFPSPEELARRRQKAEAENWEFIKQIHDRNVAEDIMNPVRQTFYYQYVPAAVSPQNYDYDPYLWQFGSGYRLLRGRQNVQQQQGYFAGGQFWPLPSQKLVRKPLWVSPRRK